MYKFTEENDRILTCCGGDWLEEDVQDEEEEVKLVESVVLLLSSKPKYSKALFPESTQVTVNHHHNHREIEIEREREMSFKICNTWLT